MNKTTTGMLIGFLGVLSFSLSLPMNRLAVAGLDPAWVAAARAVLASLAGALVLAFTRTPWPAREQLKPLLLAALGVVVGFPMFTSFAMQFTSASHGAIVIALLPIGTTIAATQISGERPSAAFWLCACLGAAVVLAFVMWQAGFQVGSADFLLVLAVIAGAFGYAWGGKAASQLGGWQTICWIVVLSAPVAIPSLLVLSWLHMRPLPVVANSAWLAVLYLGLISQLVGFFFWYGGMAIGGIAKVSQVQLLQLFLTLAFSALLLGEAVGWQTWLVALLIVVVITAARLAPVRTVARRAG